MLASALGVLGWSPDTFWKATSYEYTAAMKGHLLAKGVNLEGGMTRNEFLALKAKDEQGKAG
ncbi:hypothetical protein ACVIHC_002193 [Bradyrhizobium diazoefficiens]